jgi:RND family efflux transporter MFP subunit
MQAWLQGFSRSYAILTPFTYIVRILMSRKAWRRILILLVLLAVIAGLAGWRLSGRKSSEKPDTAPPLIFQAKELTQASLASIGQSIELSGSLYAPDSVTIKAKSTGQLRRLNVVEGQFVQRGQAIGSLDLTELQSRLAERKAALAAAKTAMTQASTQWEANQRLSERGFIAPTAIETSRASLESAKAQVQAAESALQTVQVQLRDADLIAPISGWVQKRLAMEGEKLATEQAIVSILNTDRLEIHTQAAASYAQQLALGYRQNFRVDGLKALVAAQLSRIMPSADPNARALTLVWAISGNPDMQLRPGQFAIASVDLPGEQQRLTLPVEAIRQEAGKSVAWIIADGKLSRKALITGRRSPDGTRIEILDGLTPDAKVLAMRFDGLREGQEASIANPDQPPATPATPAKGSQAKS